MKKILALLMTAFLLTACGSPNTTETSSSVAESDSVIVSETPTPTATPTPTETPTPEKKGWDLLSDEQTIEDSHFEDGTAQYILANHSYEMPQKWLMIPGEDIFSVEADAQVFFPRGNRDIYYLVLINPFEEAGDESDNFFMKKYSQDLLKSLSGEEADAEILSLSNGRGVASSYALTTNSDNGSIEMMSYMVFSTVLPDAMVDLAMVYNINALEDNDQYHSDIDKILSSFDLSDTNYEEPETSNSVSENDSNVPAGFISDMNNPELAEKTYSILTKDIGFTDLTYVERTEWTDNYEFTANGFTIMMTAFSDEEGDYIRIWIPNSQYTLYEDGELLMTASDLVTSNKENSVSEDDLIAFYIIAQEIVEDNLKNPKSAKFPSYVFNSDEIYFGYKDGIAGVQSYVTAQNSFGASVKSNWIVEFKVIDLTTYTYETVYVNIDGQEAGTYVEL